MTFPTANRASGFPGRVMRPKYRFIDPRPLIPNGMVETMRRWLDNSVVSSILKGSEHVRDVENYWRAEAKTATELRVGMGRVPEIRLKPIERFDMVAAIDEITDARNRMAAGYAREPEMKLRVRPDFYEALRTHVSELNRRHQHGVVRFMGMEVKREAGLNVPWVIECTEAAEK